MKKYSLYIAIALCGLLVIVLFKNQLKNYWVYLILLACPLMHIFMMKGMHGNRQSNTDKVKTNQDIKEKPNNTKSCH